MRKWWLRNYFGAWLPKWLGGTMKKPQPLDTCRCSHPALAHKDMNGKCPCGCIEFRKAETLTCQ